MSNSLTLRKDNQTYYLTFYIIYVMITYQNKRR